MRNRSHGRGRRAHGVGMARSRLECGLEPCPRVDEWTRSRAQDQEMESTRPGMAKQRWSLTNWGSGGGGGAARARGGEQARTCGGATDKFTAGGEYGHDLRSRTERKGKKPCLNDMWVHG
jgi:hypothetical protein